MVLMAVDHANYFVAQQYVSALGKFADSPNQKILFLPLEASSVIGAIGGIAEIAKETFGPGGNGGPSGPPTREPGGGNEDGPAAGPWSRPENG